MSEDREEFLKDIVIGFVEDYGTNCWRQIKGRTYDPDAGVAVFYDVEEDGTPAEHTVTTAVVARGLAMIRNRKSNLNETMEKSILAADRESDAGQIDAYDADAIVQLGVFGQVIYG